MEEYKKSASQKLREKVRKRILQIENDSLLWQAWIRPQENQNHLLAIDPLRRNDESLRDQGKATCKGHKIRCKQAEQRPH